jgi:RimJ/RimL family protein N-acetyltransferase
LVVDLGFWIRASAAGKGLATAAARLISSFGFEELGLLRIEILVAVENAASERVAQKLGALREGVLRNRLFLHGRSHDAAVHSLIAEKSAIGDSGT